MNSNTIQFYKPFIRNIYTTGDYKLDPVFHKNTHSFLTYSGSIFVGTYSSYFYPNP